MLKLYRKNYLKTARRRRTNIIAMVKLTQPKKGTLLSGRTFLARHARKTEETFLLMLLQNVNIQDALQEMVNKAEALVHLQNIIWLF